MMNPRELAYTKQVYPGFDFEEISKRMTNEDLISDLDTIIKDACYSLEGSCKNLAILTEDGYSDFVAERINGNKSFKCRREEDNNGHVDLKVTSIHKPENEFTYMGEAKVWQGDSYLEKGFLQLTSYLSGREDYAFMLIYFSSEKVDTLFKNHISFMVNRGNGHTPQQNTRHAIFTHDYDNDKPIKISYYGAKVIKKPADIKKWIAEQQQAIQTRWEAAMKKLGLSKNLKNTK